MLGGLRVFWGLLLLLLLLFMPRVRAGGAGRVAVLYFLVLLFFLVLLVLLLFARCRAEQPRLLSGREGEREDGRAGSHGKGKGGGINVACVCAGAGARVLGCAAPRWYCVQSRLGSRSSARATERESGGERRDMRQKAGLREGEG